MSKKYYWLKLKTNWFSDKRIKKLRSIAGGDTYVVIYLKMMLLSLNDEGKLYFEGVEEDFASELALELDEDAENVKVTLSFLQKNGLMELCEEDEYLLNEVPASIGSESPSAGRMRKLRAAQGSQLPDKKASHCDSHVTASDGEVTTSDTEKEIDIEKEKEVITVSKDTVRQTEIRQVMEKWNELSSFGISQVSRVNSGTKRYKGIVARIKEYGMEAVLSAIESIKHSRYLQGKVPGYDWSITFDWFVKPNNFPKVLEGNYRDNSFSSSNDSGGYGNRLAELENEDGGGCQ